MESPTIDSDRVLSITRKFMTVDIIDGITDFQCCKGYEGLCGKRKKRLRKREIHTASMQLNWHQDQHLFTLGP